jgi:hypothetical protein
MSKLPATPRLTAQDHSSQYPKLMCNKLLDLRWQAFQSTTHQPLNTAAPTHQPTSALLTAQASALTAPSSLESSLLICPHKYSSLQPINLWTSQQPQHTLHAYVLPTAQAHSTPSPKQLSKSLLDFHGKAFQSTAHHPMNTAAPRHQPCLCLQVKLTRLLAPRSWQRHCLTCLPCQAFQPTAHQLWTQQPRHTNPTAAYKWSSQHS